MCQHEPKQNGKKKLVVKVLDKAKNFNLARGSPQDLGEQTCRIIVYKYHRSTCIDLFRSILRDRSSAGVCFKLRFWRVSNVRYLL